jgi:uncharacterized protein YlzI (FlbEa/FlbD family)
MVKFIELTRPDGKKVLINIGHITTIEPPSGDYEPDHNTSVNLSGGFSRTVIETVKKIDDMIRATR